MKPDDGKRERKEAEWGEEGKEPPTEDPRVMTREDLLGTYASDLLTWSREREEPWDREGLARELVLRQLVGTAEELDEYKKAVKRDIEAATARLAEWVRAGAGSDPKLSDAIEDSRMDSAIDAIDAIDFADIESARSQLDE